MNESQDKMINDNLSHAQVKKLESGENELFQYSFHESNFPPLFKSGRHSTFNMQCSSI